MGLDLSLNHKVCEHCHRAEESLDFGYTYNVSPMWRAIFPNHERFVPIDGLSGEESYLILRKAIKCMKESRKELEKLNPTNGWGDYKTFLKWVIRLACAARQYPYSIWSADR